MSDKSLLESAKKFTRPSVVVMLFYGFSAGVPILLIFSSLSLWLREAGIEKSSVTYFSWAALGYSFKFIWAPLVDSFPLPVLHKILGRRRSWILLSQIGIVLGILGMAFTNPALEGASLTMMALFAVLLGFSSATQDISIDAFRIESDTAEMQALLSSTYIVGYRIGMILAGAGALVLAQYFGSSKETYMYSAWRWTYIVMAGSMLVGIITTFFVKEPESQRKQAGEYTNLDYAKFLFLFLMVSAAFGLTYFLSRSYLLDTYNSYSQMALGENVGGFVSNAVVFIKAIVAASLVGYGLSKSPLINKEMAEETYVSPIRDFFDRYGASTAILLLSLIGLYRISDIVLGVISNVFYQDMNFTNIEIAGVVKTFGLVMTIVGGLLGGVLTLRYGVMRILFWGAVLSAATNVLFMVMAHMGHNLPMLYVVISADNLAAGVATAAFVAFLSSLTNVSFTAMQYAIFTSLMTLFPKLFGGFTGSIVDAIGYSSFFAFTTVLGIPVLYLVWLAGKRLDINDPVSQT